MIDEIVELLLDVIVEFIPNSVWKILAFVVGAVATAAGVLVIDESLWTGGALITVGLFLLAGSVISWFR
ncbi:hypothetical protein [Halonotius pteroides]|uniref:Uncharacterized protein n=1 Tax=Halonotius pteroides TaxID=268735 RepID=A0A3A6Q111_9EURY|nr:hypothetical protein [Halonotius pteroides]RJX48943.1 hypothetical protein DP106_10415 [Halonotius pteroides]